MSLKILEEYSWSIFSRLLASPCEDDRIEAQRIARELGCNDLRRCSDVDLGRGGALYHSFSLRVRHYYVWSAQMAELFLPKIERSLIAHLRASGYNPQPGLNTLKVFLVDPFLPRENGSSQFMQSGWDHANQCVFLSMVDDVAVWYEVCLCALTSCYRGQMGDIFSAVSWLNQGTLMAIQHGLKGRRGRDNRVAFARLYFDGYLWLTRLFLREIGWGGNSRKLIAAYCGDVGMHEALRHDIASRFGEGVTDFDLNQLCMGFDEKSRDLTARLFRGEHIAFRATSGFGLAVKYSSLIKLFPGCTLETYRPLSSLVLVEDGPHY